jgi:carbamoyl-phosphate synthase large subunit
MAIGRTFKEALQKGIRGLEIKRPGLTGVPWASETQLRELLVKPNAERLFHICEALRRGWTVEKLYEATRIDPWFLSNIKEIVDFEPTISEAVLREAKQKGFSDTQIAARLGKDEDAVRDLRLRRGIRPAFKLVDTCAAEFEAFTPYYYSTYDGEDESQPTDRKKIMILGGGPNRIGQGIEFDYCCVHAAFALREIGFETIMVNSNPETVSTDYDTSDKLYFEPLTKEDVIAIAEREKPHGVIVQLGGQTPLNLAVSLEQAGLPIIGTSPDSIDRAEDRNRFSDLVRKLGLRQPENGAAVDEKGALAAAHQIGYPVVVRPSYVLGGRAMEIVYDDGSLLNYMRQAVWASPERPVLIDRFIEDAIEVDVDMVSDGQTFVIGGIMEHVEEAGVHSGDAAMVLPPHTLQHWMLEEIRRYTTLLAAELHVIGLMNVQYAVRGKELYIIEVNPRASRTVPFVSKAIGVPLAKVAAKVMAGMSLKEIGFTEEVHPRHVSVKESVLPFARFPGVDIILGPEMKSTGEVMGIDMDFGRAYCKSQLGALLHVPLQGTVFISVKNDDKTQLAVSVAYQLEKLGFSLLSTVGTAAFLKGNGIRADVVKRVSDGSTELLEKIRSNGVQLIINTPSGPGPRTDEISIRAVANSRGIPVVTTMPGADAYVQGIRALIRGELGVTPIQRYHAAIQRDRVIEKPQG